MSTGRNKLQCCFALSIAWSWWRATGRQGAKFELKPSLEKKCHELVGREDREGGRSHVGQLQAQCFSDCMMGAPY
jgi:hypothetical protein